MAVVGHHQVFRKKLVDRWITAIAPMMLPQCQSRGNFVPQLRGKGTSKIPDRPIQISRR
jgi:hypothetical protein